MKFGDRIKQRRLDLHMSAGELASLIGKNRATIYRYENGDIENVPLDVLDPLSEALDTTPEYLMGWTDSKYISTRTIQGKKETVYIGMNEATVQHFEIWYDIFGLEHFTDEEFQKLIEYGRFLLYLRNNK